MNENICFHTNTDRVCISIKESPIFTTMSYGNSTPPAPATYQNTMTIINDAYDAVMRSPIVGGPMKDSVTSAIDNVIRYVNEVQRSPDISNNQRQIGYEMAQRSVNNIAFSSFLNSI